jgi:hypothetical protein
MQMIPVKSSNVKGVGHSLETLTLHVTYHHGGTYTFSPVSAAMFQSLLQASSIGKAVSALGIKGTKI